MHRSISSLLAPAALCLVLAVGRALATPSWSEADVLDPAR